MPAFTNIQILLTVVILTLTGLLVFIGVQVIFILREVHRATKKLNETGQHANNSPFSILRQAFSSIQNHPKIALEEERMSPNTDTKITTSQYLTLLQQEVGEEKSESFPHITALQERGRTSGRVFHRAGKPLA